LIATRTNTFKFALKKTQHIHNRASVLDTNRASVLDTFNIPGHVVDDCELPLVPLLDPQTS
jgi:hypothetical protein